MNIAAEFVMHLFHARTAAHVMHLTALSYAQHKALEDFYEGIVGLADSFAETYQGAYGALLPFEGTPYFHPTSAIGTFTDLRTWIARNRDHVCDKDDSTLQNIIDEIQALISSTLYKLRFLK